MCMEKFNCPKNVHQEISSEFSGIFNWDATKQSNKATTIF